MVLGLNLPQRRGKTALRLVAETSLHQSKAHRMNLQATLYASRLCSQCQQYHHDKSSSNAIRAPGNVCPLSAHIQPCRLFLPYGLCAGSAYSDIHLNKLGGKFQRMFMAQKKQVPMLATASQHKLKDCAVRHAARQPAGSFRENSGRNQCRSISNVCISFFMSNQMLPCRLHAPEQVIMRV